MGLNIERNDQQNSVTGLVKLSDRQIQLKSSVDLATSTLVSETLTGETMLLALMQENSNSSMLQEEILGQALFGLVEGFEAGAMTKRSFDLKFQSIVRVSPVIDKNGIYGSLLAKRMVSLVESPDEEVSKRAMEVCSVVSTSAMEKLGRPDLEFCEPKRMADYIRTLAFRVVQKFGTGKPESWKGEMFSDVFNLCDTLDTVLGMVLDRDDDEEDGFADQVFALLRDDGYWRETNIPMKKGISYVEKGLFILAGKDYDTARELYMTYRIKASDDTF